jgi:hypothetical protein
MKLESQNTNEASITVLNDSLENNSEPFVAKAEM